MEWELWGSYSVKDHLRARPFIADLFLYHRLMVPVPPDEHGAEWKRWQTNGYEPERQKSFLR